MDVTLTQEEMDRIYRFGDKFTQELIDLAIKMIKYQCTKILGEKTPEFQHKEDINKAYQLLEVATKKAKLAELQALQAEMDALPPK